MPLLSVLQLSRYFGGLAALSNVTFDLHKGEILGLIGPNGAGKTTLFNVINGFHRPSRGNVVFKGKDISHARTNKICALGLARTFQVVRPLRRMTVLDNVVTSAFLRAGSKSEAIARSQEILEFTGLQNDGDTVSKGLSLGKRKRLEIARALATEPELLLLDESFAGLNPSELNESIGIIRKIKEKGVTIMVIEHHMKVIMSISDRIVVLNYGEKIAEGTPAEIVKNPLVITAYLGETEHAPD